MKFVILTGMSGAGKSTALKMMEDIGFYCVDNLPIPLLEKFSELTELQQNAELQKVAVGIDIRSGQALEELRDVLDRIEAKGGSYEILFLDAEDGVLVKRYKETRRTHPLAGSSRFCPLGLSTGSLPIPTLYSMSVFCQTLIMWRDCVQRREMIRKYRTMCYSFRRHIRF